MNPPQAKSIAPQPTKRDPSGLPNKQNSGSNGSLNELKLAPTKATSGKREPTVEAVIVSSQMAFDPTTNQIICINTLSTGQMAVVPATAQQITQFQVMQNMNAMNIQRQTAVQPQFGLMQPNQVYQPQPEPNNQRLSSGQNNHMTSRQPEGGHTISRPEQSTQSIPRSSLQRKTTQSDKTEGSLQRKPTEYVAKKNKDVEADQKVDRMIQLPNGELISPLDGGYNKTGMRKRDSLDDILNMD